MFFVRLCLISFLTVLLSSRKVLVLEDQFATLQILILGPIVLVFVLVLGPQVLEYCQGLCRMQTVRYA